MSLITLTYLFSTGATIIASQHNTNNQVIYNDYNGSIADANIAANAAIEYTKLSLNNSIRQSDILSSTVFLVANIPKLSYSNITQYPYIKVSETQAQNTSAGNGVSGSWQTRVLNTTDTDTASISSLGSNQLTLPAGTYLVRVASPFLYNGSAQLRLQNITDASTLLTGMTVYCSQSNTGQVATIATIVGEITLSASKALAIQYQITASATNSLGLAGNFGTEVYTVAEFTKVA